MLFQSTKLAVALSKYLAIKKKHCYTLAFIKFFPLLEIKKIEKEKAHQRKSNCEGLMMMIRLNESERKKQVFKRII